MDLRSFTNHVVFSTPLGLTCCICVIHDLHSSALPHILHLLFSWVLSIFAFMLLVLLACSCAAIIKASVVLFKHPFLSHHHPSSLVLSVVFLMNCPCNCFCVQCIFPSFFFLFLYSFGVSLSSSSSVVCAVSLYCFLHNFLTLKLLSSQYLGLQSILCRLHFSIDTIRSTLLLGWNPLCIVRNFLVLLSISSS